MSKESIILQCKNTIQHLDTRGFLPLFPPKLSLFLRSTNFPIAFRTTLTARVPFFCIGIFPVIVLVARGHSFSIDIASLCSLAIGIGITRHAWQSNTFMSATRTGFISSSIAATTRTGDVDADVAFVAGRVV